MVGVVVAAAAVGLGGAQAYAQTSKVDALATEVARGVNCNRHGKEALGLVRNREFNSAGKAAQAWVLATAMICGDDRQRVDMARRLQAVAVEPVHIALADLALMWVETNEKARLQYFMHGAAAAPQVFTSLDAAYVTTLLRTAMRDEATALPALTLVTGVDWRSPYLLTRSENMYAVLLAQRRIKAGDRAGALQALKRVTDPAQLTKVAADRQYEFAWADLEAAGRFDWQAQAERHVRLMRLRATATEGQPPSAGAGSDLIKALEDAGMTEAAMLIGEDWRAHLAKDTRQAEEGAWLLDGYAGVLARAGQIDKAKAVTAEAGALRTDAVSFNINMAERMRRAGREAEAVALVRNVARDRASSFGLMWAEDIRVCALRDSDPAGAAKGMAKMLAGEADNRMAVLATLVCLNRLDEAAERMVRLLADPDDRDLILDLAATGPAQTPMSPFDAMMAGRLQTLLARPDVAPALEKVGRRVAVTAPLLRGFDY